MSESLQKPPVASKARPERHSPNEKRAGMPGSGSLSPPVIHFKVWGDLFKVLPVGISWWQENRYPESGSPLVQTRPRPQAEAEWFERLLWHLLSITQQCVQKPQACTVYRNTI